MYSISKEDTVNNFNKNIESLKLVKRFPHTLLQFKTIIMIGIDKQNYYFCISLYKVIIIIILLFLMCSNIYWVLIRWNKYHKEVHISKLEKTINM